MGPGRVLLSCIGDDCCNAADASLTTPEGMVRHMQGPAHELPAEHIIDSFHRQQQTCSGRCRKRYARSLKLATRLDEDDLYHLPVRCVRPEPAHGLESVSECSIHLLNLPSCAQAKPLYPVVLLERLSPSLFGRHWAKYKDAELARLVASSSERNSQRNKKNVQLALPVTSSVKRKRSALSPLSLPSHSASRPKKRVFSARPDEPVIPNIFKRLMEPEFVQLMRPCVPPPRPVFRPPFCSSPFLDDLSLEDLIDISDWPVPFDSQAGMDAIREARCVMPPSHDSLPATCQGSRSPAAVLPAPSTSPAAASVQSSLKCPESASGPRAATALKLTHQQKETAARTVVGQKPVPVTFAFTASMQAQVGVPTRPQSVKHPPLPPTPWVPALKNTSGEPVPGPRQEARREDEPLATAESTGRGRPKEVSKSAKRGSDEKHGADAKRRCRLCFNSQLRFSRPHLDKHLEFAHPQESD